MESDVLKFLEIYSKTMQAENKFVSESVWSALKLIQSLQSEIAFQAEEIKELQKRLKKYDSK